MRLSSMYARLGSPVQNNKLEIIFPKNVYACVEAQKTGKIVEIKLGLRPALYR